MQTRANTCVQSHAQVNYTNLYHSCRCRWTCIHPEIPLYWTTPGPGEVQGTKITGLPWEWGDIITPIRFWISELAIHPDKDFVDWICRGITQGFRIGFSDKDVELQSARINMLSAVEHPQVVSNYLRGELTSHHLHLVGMASLAKLPRIHLSPLGVIPKRGIQTAGVSLWIYRQCTVIVSMMG